MFGVSGTGWVAHAGLGRHNSGGTPTAETLRQALAMGVDAVELDVCVTSDRVLVLRHDLDLAPRVALASVNFETLRHLEPATLTLEEGLGIIGARSNVLLDVKSAETAHVLCARLAATGALQNVSVCTEVTAALTVLQRRAPAVPRWMSLPNIGGGPRRGTRVVVSTLLGRRSKAMALSMVSGVGRAVVAARRSPTRALAHLGGIPWNSWLPEEIVDLARLYEASGLCLHHWLVSPAVVEACHEAGLPVVAYTVNRPADAERALRAGVDLITTDRVEAMRRAAEQWAGGLLPGGIPAPVPPV